MSITSYIRDDLAARLRAGHELATPLTLDRLADYYKVSFTPVRAAVSELIAQGLLEKRPNRRLAVCCRSGKVGGKADPEIQGTAPKRPQDALAMISDDLVRLSLQGEPVCLREEATAEKYAISRSAIRNIFHQLAGEGMLDHLPRRGWRLRPFRRSDLKSFLEVREVLELKALELAQPRLTDEELTQILNANRIPETSSDVPQIDESLHSYLVATSQNSYIKDFFLRQGRYYTLLFEWEDLDRDTAIETVQQHRTIIKAMLAGDWGGARQSLSDHILNNHPILDRAPFAE